MELRQRGNRSNNSLQMETFEVLEKPDDTDDETIKNQKCLSAVPTLLATLAAMGILNAFVYYMDTRLPGIIDQNSTKKFVAKRAMSTLTKLADIGPRPVGSYANEVLAFDLLKTEIEGIMNETDNVNDVNMSNQNVSGAFVLDNSNFRYALSYEDLQNVVVKIDPKRGASDAILLNCHFDSVPAGPGVSDDGVNCALMVEVLRVLAKSPKLERPVIFLFNGGEEIVLQAAHGFVTQHPWARDAKYVVNLDSCGAGGRETLFQTTGDDSYLVDVYANSVPHPYGQVVGEELFRSGIIPSDTDFRIFRDFGKMTGLDMAHYKNGYVYHTRYDDVDRVEPSVLQNTGDNVLALTVALSTHVPPPECIGRKMAQTDSYVFFDVLGVYMFAYPELSGVLAHLVIVPLSLFSVVLSLRWTTAGMNRGEYGSHVLWTCVAYPCGTVTVSVMSCTWLASMFDILGHSMSWYGNKMHLVAYFATASLAMLSAAVFQPRAPCRTAAQWTVSALNGVQLFWTAALFFATMAGLRSAYLFAIMVLFPALTSCALGITGASRAPRLWIVAYAASMIPPIVFAFYLTQMFVSLFAPVAGRFGPRFNPDYIVGGLMSLSAYATVGSLAPVVALVKNPRTLLYAVAAVAVASALAVFTPLGFPYSDGGSGGMPASQRFDVIHTRRTFYNFDGTARRDDTGYAIVNWDRRSRGTAAKYVPHMADAVDADCAGELLCGSSIAGPLVLFSSWLPRSATPQTWPADKCDAQMVVANATDQRQRRVMRFNVTGPERINVYVSPFPGTRLVSWSFSPGQPEPSTVWMGNDVHVIKRSRGGRDNRTWSFWLEHESSRGFDEKTINVTVVYNWVIHERLQSSLDPEFREFIDSFPSWAHVNHAVARVDAFVY